MKKITVSAVILGLFIVGCGVSSTTNDIPTPTPTFVEESPTSPAKSGNAKAPVAPKKTVVTIGGDDIVHVGSDVPAGTYRTKENADSNCYWAKTKDAEGSDIIDNGIPSGGRPQVTLKKGQWFTSQGCPVWIKQ